MTRDFPYSDVGESEFIEFSASEKDSKTFQMEIINSLGREPFVNFLFTKGSRVGNGFWLSVKDPEFVDNMITALTYYRDVALPRLAKEK